MYIVFFKKQPNLYVTHYQNENRRIGSKCFKTREDAIAFAKTVDVDSIFNPAGNEIKF